MAKNLASANVGFRQSFNLLTTGGHFRRSDFVMLGLTALWCTTFLVELIWRL